MSGIWIGTSGWTYKGWRELFYPKDVPQKRWLPYYSTQFNTTENVSVFTPDNAIEVTRIQVTTAIAPSGCSISATVRLSDGTPTGTQDVTINSGSVSTGPLSLLYSSGLPITVSVRQAATCGGNSIAPQNANVVVQYHAQ